MTARHRGRSAPQREKGFELRFAIGGARVIVGEEVGAVPPDVVAAAIGALAFNTAENMGQAAEMWSPPQLKHPS